MSAAAGVTGELVPLVFAAVAGAAGVWVPLGSRVRQVSCRVKQVCDVLGSAGVIYIAKTQWGPGCSGVVVG